MLGVFYKMDLREQGGKRYEIINNPQSNPVERFHRDLGRMIKSLLPREDNHWCTLLPTICSAYNYKVNESTRHTPNMVFFGREINLPKDFLVSKRSQVNM